ncbi:hypothetical protein, partial [Klebsiella pneumoniae]|uniref:hypothetical protein n=1 Tax=Klebsiella pneumoniae TaxID=573 RepID=UPI0025A2F6EE
GRGAGERSDQPASLVSVERAGRRELLLREGVLPKQAVLVPMGQMEVYIGALHAGGTAGRRVAGHDKVRNSLGRVEAVPPEA